jgi:uncharacterized protein YicC (UPF0701 family)
MSKVRICVEIPDEAYRAFQEAAEREGLDVQALLERTVDNLLKELEKERRDGFDPPITPA